MKTDFTPVFPIYYDVFSEEQKKSFCKVYYFGIGTHVEEAQGKIIQLVKKGSIEEYLVFDTGDEVRIDRIISINGKPGPAYDEYDAYSLACLDCNVGGD